ncbi:hypothetical protein OCAR_6627 [Afipia carboxidovorans OM5]|nr:hypothetical protein OCAR_6627 [Afipia carboxidovorans OM5]
MKDAAPRPGHHRRLDTFFTSPRRGEVQKKPDCFVADAPRNDG